ncbi:MAG: succinate--CoA ligase subunit beta [Candidatus Lokiarchaeota archaeon]|nr:succinate--CoA ligase subunit beta [Candidatus Lokiarchaeota archaeon]
MLEYESKRIFNRFEIPLAENIIIEKGEIIEDKVNQFTFPAIVKSQIAIGSRKKAGLIKIANSKEEAISLCKEFFSREVAGFQVEAILIEELVKIDHEYYCSIALDASGGQFYIIASKEGGIDIEEVSRNNPEAIIKVNFTLKEGLSEDLAKKVSAQLGFKDEFLDSAIGLFKKLWEITKILEAQLVEINPLVLTPSGLVAVDGKMILDDDTAFRQSIVQELQNKKLSQLEKLAKDSGFSFVELSGEIGILANGAGLTMALLDVLSELGLNPANFLDVGGGASKERVYSALKLLFKMNPKTVLVNIFGGITRCDVVAEAIIQALEDFKDTPPLVIRLIGTNDKEGIALLNNAGITAYQNIMDAVQKVKEVVGE